MNGFPATRASSRRQPWSARARLLLIAAPLAANLMLIGCGSAQPPAGPATSAPVPQRGPTLSGLHAVSGQASRTYLGAVTGTRAFIGIVVDGRHERAYLCDGTPRRAGTLADWFGGLVRNGSFTATSSQHHVRLAARIGPRRGTGTVTLADGRTLPFTITVASATHQAGIFAGAARYRGRTYRAGWILLPGGDERGAAFYPSGPVRGLIIAVSNYPVGPI